MTVGGLHHVTAIASNPARNMHFYRDVLGLRLIKRTINFDDPGTWHVYFGNETGTPGSVLTFFPHPDARPARHGPGQAGEIAFTVPEGSLGFWAQRLKEAGFSPVGPVTVFGRSTLTVADPDNLQLAFVEVEGAHAQPCWSEGGVSARHAIRVIDGVTFWQRDPQEMVGFLTGHFGYRVAGEEGDVTRLVTNSAPHSAHVDIRRVEEARRGALGAGAIHHVAFRASDDAAEAKAAEGLRAEGFNVTDQIDRNYFHSVYLREPGGAIIEIATDAPGFTVDEPLEKLGHTLQLPPWLEARRDAIEASLPPLE